MTASAGNIPQLTTFLSSPNGGDDKQRIDRWSQHVASTFNAFARRMSQQFGDLSGGAQTPSGPGGSNDSGPTGPNGPPGPPGPPGSPGPANLRTGSLVSDWQWFGSEFGPVGGVSNGVTLSAISFTATGWPVVMGYCAKNLLLSATPFDITAIPLIPDGLLNLQGFVCGGDPAQTPGPGDKQTFNLIVRVRILNRRTLTTQFIELLNARATWLPVLPQSIGSQEAHVVWQPSPGSYQLTLEAAADIGAGTVTRCLTIVRRIMFYAVEV